MVRSNGENLGRVGVRLKIDNSDGVIEGVDDGSVADPVLVCGAMDIHISIS